jgi:cytochrome c oxidase assembly protein subunit 15
LTEDGGQRTEDPPSPLRGFHLRASRFGGQVGGQATDNRETDNPDNHQPTTVNRQPMIWLHRYAKLVTVFTVLLIAAGGMVTSTGSGLSVPDWPTTYGWNMFTFPLSKWVGGIRYEHSHRLIASTVGFLTIILALWTWRVEPRRWVRTLGFLCLAAVILQGLLGGLTVLLLLPPAVSIGHAGLAQIFFCLTLTLALVTSPGWRTPTTRDSRPATRDSGLATRDSMLRGLATVTTVAIYAQIILGAAMRHTDAGLAIPTFPLAFGHLVPPAWSPQIAIHYAHRVGALAVTLAILATAGHVFVHHRDRRELAGPSLLLLAFVCSQVTLGAFVVLTAMNPVVNTAHVVNGALVLGTSLVLTLRSYRATVSEARTVSAPISRQPIPRSARAAGGPASAGEPGVGPRRALRNEARP